LKETYAPVSRLAIVRAALAIINKLNLFACQMDVKTAFLNGTLEDDIYMSIPDGVECDEITKKNKICKLKKALYGLKISPKRWNKKFAEVAKELGLKNDFHEPCLFTWREKGELAFIVLYVDDLLIASNNQIILNKIKTKLNERFQMKDLGEPDVFLGMKIVRDKKNRVTKISQTEYTMRILERSNMLEARSHDTPMVTRQVKKRELRKRSAPGELIVQKTKVPFREAVGSLLYLAGATRPDIAYAVGCLSRRQLNPTEDDWEEAKRVFAYLRATTNIELIYRGDSDDLAVFTDASLMDCEGSKSTSGYALKLFGDLISWRSHKQSIVAHSSCEAEYLALSESCQEIISIDKAVRWVLGYTLFPATIWCDNKSAMDNTEMEGSHKLKKFDDSIEKIKRDLQHTEETGNRVRITEAHGDFVKACLIEGRVKVRWVSTKDNLADIFTKPLSRFDFRKFRSGLMNLD